MNNSETLSILSIVENTVVDGPGFRTAIYSAGCTNSCKGCHNPLSWNIENGHQMTIDDILNIIMKDPFSQVTFSGGDPFFQVEGFTTLAKRVKENTEKDIWCYTGYLYENIKSSSRMSKLLPYIDVLVDGPFILSKKDDDLLFRGSYNQRLIDVRKSLRNQQIEEFIYNPFLEIAL